MRVKLRENGRGQADRQHNNVKPNTHRRRDATVELSLLGVGGNGAATFLPVPANVQLQRPKALRGEEWGGGVPSPAD